MQQPFLQCQTQKSKQILTQCDNNTLKSTKCYSSYIKPLKKSMLPPYVFDPKQSNPQQKQYINKYVQKVTQQLKRAQKQKTIRKTEMGQNQMVFTYEEQLKLEIIDQFMEKGYYLPTDPFSIELFPKGQEQGGARGDNVVGGGIGGGEGEDMGRVYRREIGEFQNWGQFGNKEDVLDILDDFGKYYVENIDLKAIEKQKNKKKKKQAKLLNFVNVCNRNSGQNMRKTNSGFCFRQSSLTAQAKHRKKDKILSLASVGPALHIPSTLSPSQSQNSIQLQLPHFHKPHPKPNPHTHMPHPASCHNKKQKLLHLTQTTLHKYQKIQPSLYMTTQRKQALFNSEIIKGTKELISRKDYIDFKFVIESNGGKGKGQGVEEKEGEKGEKEGVETGWESIGKILEINRGRIKYEKQRIIEKLRC